MLLLPFLLGAAPPGWVTASDTDPCSQKVWAWDPRRLSPELGTRLAQYTGVGLLLSFDACDGPTCPAARRPGTMEFEARLATLDAQAQAYVQQWSVPNPPKLPVDFFGRASRLATLEAEQVRRPIAAWHAHSLDPLRPPIAGVDVASCESAITALPPMESGAAWWKGLTGWMNCVNGVVRTAVPDPSADAPLVLQAYGAIVADTVESDCD